MAARQQQQQTQGARAAERRATAWAVAAIVGATVAAYANSFSGPLFFDDTASVVQNESIRALWPLSEVLWPPTGAGTAGRPLLNFSYALNYAAGGLDVWGYHAVNLAIHGAAALVLFALVRRVLRLPALREKLGGAATEVAAVSALLWAVHPLQTESVTYISQRAESLVGFFYLLTWYAFVRGADAADEGSGGARRWRVGAVAALVAGVLTKEIVATAPVVLAAFDVLFLAGSWREAWARRRGLYLGFLGAWVLLGALMVRSNLQVRGVGFGGKMPWLDYVATEVEAVALYLKLSVWPHPLVIDYGVTPARGGGVFLTSVAVVGAFIGAIVVAARRRWAAVAFAGAAALVMLAPTSSVVPVGNQPIAEHRMYLPLALLVVAAVAASYVWWGRRALVVAAMVALGFGAMSGMRNEDYRTEVAIWRDAATKRPENWRAHATLGLAWFREQRLAEGLAALEVALKLNATEPMLWNNYANALALPMVGRLAEAIAAGERAVQLDPMYAEARNSLASALLKVGRGADAVVQFEAASRLRPESAEIRANLCDALRQVGRVAEAVAAGEAAVKLKPNFAVALLNAGRLGEAEAQLVEALRLNPNYVEAHNSLGIVWAKLGRLAEAGEAFETVLRLRPDHAGARGNLQLLRDMRGAGPAGPRE